MLAALDGGGGAAAGGRPLASCGWSVDVRYRGQAYELTVPLAARPVTDATLARAMRGFHAAHRRAYGHATPGAPTEIVTVRCRATIALAGPARSPRRPPPRAPSAAATCTASGTPCTTAWRWTRRRVLHGPAIVEQEDSTVHVPAGWTLRGAPGGTLLLERG